MKKGKKFLSFSLALLLALGCLPLSVGAKESSGTCGENLTWTLSGEGVLTISGSGEMEDYFDISASAPWDYEIGIKTLVIEDGVTSIGDGAFGACESLHDISLPDSLVKIGKYAFSSCYELTSVSIPASVTSMGEGVFFDCYQLESIQVAESNPAYASRDGVLFDKAFTTLIQFPGGQSGKHSGRGEQPQLCQPGRRTVQQRFFGVALLSGGEIRNPICDPERRDQY